MTELDFKIRGGSEAVLQVFQFDHNFLVSHKKLVTNKDATSNWPTNHAHKKDWELYKGEEKFEEDCVFLNYAGAEQVLLDMDMCRRGKESELFKNIGKRK